MTSELQNLAKDLSFYQSLMKGDRSALAKLGDKTDPRLQNYRQMLADLTLRMFSHSWGILHLVQEDLREPTFAVARALYESQVTMSYLVHHKQGRDEAAIYLAASLLKQERQVGSGNEPQAAPPGPIASIPEAFVDEARRRLKVWPKKWSGMTIAAMAKAGGFPEHDRVYDMFCQEAHAATAGERILIDWEKGVGSISLGLRGLEAESVCCMARRCLKWGMQWLWGALDGPSVTMPTPDPDKWQPSAQGQ